MQPLLKNAKKRVFSLGAVNKLFPLETFFAPSVKLARDFASGLGQVEIVLCHV